MSDELLYSSLILPKPRNSSLIVKKNEETVYAEVKISELPPSEIGKSRKEGTDPTLSELPEKPGPRFQRYRKVTMCLAVLCPFLLLGITATCACHFSAQCKLLSTYAGEQLRGSSAAKERLQMINSNLTAENADLEREMRELKSERDTLNRKLEAILQFSNFPVKKYCTVKNSDSKERHCSPCPDGWKQYNSSCYYVYLSSSWKTWPDSRQECIKMGADLVTIDSEDEQRFISELAPSYFDQWHGYWIGLCKITRGWFWVNGAPLTEEFWINEPNNDENRCALTNTKDNTLKSWRSAYSWQMRNRWICENKALIF
ncbi:C-type lectin domain family 9 member A-like isoform X2 [Scleropages formosus]|uniref:C-type lectin domain family 4 member C-like n=1 Tax=Scleropages formosus TaxID=113540 RepID=A0A8C9SNB5_SCLFO|nr:C-type lectin domain family 9 member A-like isoform X2 [Scleropages formosus]